MFREYTEDTGVSCPVCQKGKITAHVTWSANGVVPDGPGWSNYYFYRVKSFYCSACQLLFRHPPGMPKAEEEILKRMPKVKED